MWRQGDLLIVACEDIPEDAKLVAGCVLALGEATGHKHEVRTGAKQFVTAAGQQFLKVVDRAVNLHHEEHATIVLKNGNYKVVRQREYTPEAIRQVND